MVLFYRKRTTTAQKDPSHMIGKLVGYIMHVRRLNKQFQFPNSSILAMDETPVWADMVSSTTVDKTGAIDVPLKTTGHEKVRVSVCLTAKGDGTKLKPFIVFVGAKRESKNLHEEYKRQCSVASSTNGWMNEELTLRWVDEVVGKFAFSKRLLAWDSYEAHMTENVKRRLKDANTESVIVPGGCTKYIQAPDVVWNKPFKQRVAELYDEWLANGVHEFTVGGNMKSVPRRLVIDWVLTAWKALPKDMVASSFKKCALTIDDNGDEDEEISCFKPKRPCAEGYKVLKEQMTIFEDQQGYENPFEITDSDVEDAQFEGNILSEDEEGDIEID